MLKWKALALLALLSFAAFAGPAMADEDDVELDDDDDEEPDELERAVLLIRRRVEDKRPLEGKQTTVTTEIYNAGTLSAVNVKVSEAAWPAEFETEGELGASFDSIPAGATVTHTYKVTPTSASSHVQPPATVSYTAEEEGELQTTSSAPLRFATATLFDNMQFRALELGSKLTAGNFSTTQDWLRLAYLVAAGAALYFGMNGYKSFNKATTDRKRAKALAELSKEN